MPLEQPGTRQPGFGALPKIIRAELVVLAIADRPPAMRVSAM
jgi:hypothetical protein